MSSVKDDGPPFAGVCKLLAVKTSKDVEGDVGTKRSHVWRHFLWLGNVEPVPVDDVSGGLDRT